MPRISGESKAPTLDTSHTGKTSGLGRSSGLTEAGGSVFAGDLQRTHPYVYSQGVWLFGDWDKALRAAGLDPERARKRRFWEQESIITQIHRMRNRHLPLYASYVMRNHPKVFYGGLRVFGSWDNSLGAAGTSLNDVREKSRLGWLRELRDAEESGREISEKLRSAIAYYFGSLRKARIALMTDPAFLRSWGKRKIIAVLLKKHRSNQRLAYAAVRCECLALVSAAERHFGAWGKALHAAGIDPDLYFVRHAWRKRKRKIRTTSGGGNR